MPFIGKQPAEAALVTGDLGDDIVTLAKLAGGTDGNIISYDSSGNPVAIATGSDGQVLTSAGAGAQPAFEAAGGGFASMQVFTSSGTWTKPSGIKIIKVTVTGSGGGGGGSKTSDNKGGGGGAAGGTAIEIVDVTSISSETVTIGAGGAGGSQNANGAAGATSSFGSICSIVVAHSLVVVVVEILI